VRSALARHGLLVRLRSRIILAACCLSRQTGSPLWSGHEGSLLLWLLIRTRYAPSPSGAPTHSRTWSFGPFRCWQAGRRSSSACSASSRARFRRLPARRTVRACAESATRSSRTASAALSPRLLGLDESLSRSRWVRCSRTDGRPVDRRHGDAAARRVAFLASAQLLGSQRGLRRDRLAATTLGIPR